MSVKRRRRRSRASRSSRGASSAGKKPLTRREVIQAGVAAVGVSALWVGREPIGDAIGGVAGAAADSLSDVLTGADGGHGLSGPSSQPTAVPASSMTTYSELGGTDLVYEIDDRSSTFRMEPAFAASLDASLRDHWSAAGWGVPAVLTTYGTWIDGSSEPSASWHHAGRAFDVGRVLGPGGTELVSCRYDLWGGTGGEREARAARAYWKLAATLHRDFAYVLTYLYDAAHHNHIHLDNGQSGAERSRFSRGSRVQVQAVQAMCTHVWDRPLSITGRWDGPTRDAAEDVLRVNGLGERFSGDDAWHAFLTATARH